MDELLDIHSKAYEAIRSRIRKTYKIEVLGFVLGEAHGICADTVNGRISIYVVDKMANVACDCRLMNASKPDGKPAALSKRQAVEVLLGNVKDGGCHSSQRVLTFLWSCAVDGAFLEAKDSLESLAVEYDLEKWMNA